MPGMGFYFDPLQMLMVGPAILLAMWAQARVRMTYAAASQIPARMSGAQAARLVLDEAGLRDVGIEPIGGELTDHYDPRDRILRLSRGVYGMNSMAAVGIAAHEAGHAIQHARHYPFLVIRNLAVPLAQLGGSTGMLVIFGGFFMRSPMLIWAGVGLFGLVAFFQLVNLPVEFDASSRAKDELVQSGVIGEEGLVHVRKVLNAAAWTYVAGTLQTVLMVAYFVLRALAATRSRDE